MPGYNMWAPRTGAFPGPTLERYQHMPLRHRVARGAIQAVAPALLTAGYRRWNYPSAKVNVATRTRSYMPPKTKKKRRRKTCCKLIKGKKVCKPKYCSKNKYWY